jgi:high-affinity Fe2+/Pb2+ permease
MLVCKGDNMKNKIYDFAMYLGTIGSVILGFAIVWSFMEVAMALFGYFVGALVALWVCVAIMCGISNIMENTEKTAQYLQQLVEQNKIPDEDNKDTETK